MRESDLGNEQGHLFSDAQKPARLALTRSGKVQAVMVRLSKSKLISYPNPKPGRCVSTNKPWAMAFSRSAVVGREHFQPARQRLGLGD